MRSTIRILSAALTALLLSACGVADPLGPSALGGAPRLGIGMIGSGNITSTEGVVSSTNASGPNAMGPVDATSQIGATSTTSVLPDSADASRGGNVKGSGN